MSKRLGVGNAHVSCRRPAPFTRRGLLGRNRVRQCARIASGTGQVAKRDHDRFHREQFLGQYTSTKIENTGATPRQTCSNPHLFRFERFDVKDRRGVQPRVRHPEPGPPVKSMRQCLAFRGGTTLQCQRHVSLSSLVLGRPGHVKPRVGLISAGLGCARAVQPQHQPAGSFPYLPFSYLGDKQKT